MGQPLSPLDPTSQQLTLAVAGVANSAGVATFTFPSPPNGYTWTGTLSCAAAPVSAQFMMMVGATAWGSWGGDSVFGPVQVFGAGAQQTVVTASGLTPGADYLLMWIGSSDPSTLVAAAWPDPNTSSLDTAINGPTSASVVTSQPGGNLITHSSATARYSLRNLWGTLVSSSATLNADAIITATIGGVTTQVFALFAGPAQYAGSTAAGDGVFGTIAVEGGIVTDAGTDVVAVISTSGIGRLGLFYSQVAN